MGQFIIHNPNSAKLLSRMLTNQISKVLIVFIVSIYSMLIGMAQDIDVHREDFPDPIVWYTFDEITGGDTVYDQTGNSFDASTTGAAIREPEEYLYFNDSYFLRLPSENTLNGIGNFTLAFRCAIHNFTDYSSMELIRNKPYNDALNYMVTYHSMYNFFAIYNDCENSTQVSYHIVDSSFIDVVLTFRDTLASFYINGELLEENIIVPSRINYADDIRIGYGLKGAIDEFKFYNTAFNSFEVQSVFSPDTVSPTYPNFISVTQIAEDAVHILWNGTYDSVGVKGYQVYRNNSYIATTADTQFIDNGLMPDSLYRYHVQAFDYSGNLGFNSRVDSLFICSDIEIEHANTSYTVCDGDTLIFKTSIIDNHYAYQWQYWQLNQWIDIENSLPYSNSNTPELIIHEIKKQSLPTVFRLGIENECGTYYSDSLTLNYNETYNISGIVKAGTSNLDKGIAYLYKVTNELSFIIDSSEISYGYYSFNNVCYGNYKIKASPLGDEKDAYTERFYRNGYNLNTATNLFVNDHVRHLIINLLPKVLTINETGNRVIKVYPTLVNDKLFIESTYRFPESINVTIHNISGKEVFSDSMPANTSEKTLHLSGLVAGVYQILLTHDHSIIISERIIVY